MVEKQLEQDLKYQVTLQKDYKELVYHKHKLRTLFTTAQAELPEYNKFQARGGVEQPEDITLEQFTQAAIFGDPDVTERIRD